MPSLNRVSCVDVPGKPPFLVQLPGVVGSVCSFAGKTCHPSPHQLPLPTGCPSLFVTIVPLSKLTIDCTVAWFSGPAVYVP